MIKKVVGVTGSFLFYNATLAPIYPASSCMCTDVAALLDDASGRAAGTGTAAAR